jgi:chromosome segregation ATPase
MSELEAKNKQLEEANARLLKEKERLENLVDEQCREARSAEDEVTRLNAYLAKTEKKFRDLESNLNTSDSTGADLAATRKRLEQEHNELKRELQDATYRLNKAEADVANREAALSKVKAEFAAAQEANVQLKQEKSGAQASADAVYQLEAEIKKLNRQNKELLETLNQTNAKISDSAREVNALNTNCLSLESKINSLLRQREEVDASSATSLERLQRAQAELKEANARANAAEELASEIRASRRHH